MRSAAGSRMGFLEAVKIVAFCILAAIGYGVVHDLVTAHLCVEYFTIGHPKLFATESPLLLALGWGIVATWWVGLLFGVPLAFAALAKGRGDRPRASQRSASSLSKPILGLLGSMGVVAALAGLIGFALARAGLVDLGEPLASSVPVDRHVAFITDLWAHSASYLAGFVGGIVLIRRVARSRNDPTSCSPANQGRAHDEFEIGSIVTEFFALFSNRGGRRPNLRDLSDLCVSEAVFSKCVASSPQIQSLEEFIAPREALLADGTLTEFHETELSHRTECIGNIAQRICVYEKSGNSMGVPFRTRGAKVFQFIRTPKGWRIAAVAFDDERSDLPIVGDLDFDIRRFSG